MHHDSKCCISSQLDNPKQYIAGEMKPSNKAEESEVLQEAAWGENAKRRRLSERSLLVMNEA